MSSKSGTRAAYGGALNSGFISARHKQYGYSLTYAYSLTSYSPITIEDISLWSISLIAPDTCLLLAIS
jgi:hypothetical protein